MQTHIMLDIETMGTEPGCAIVSIGAILFDIETGKLMDSYYSGIDLNSCVDAGLKIEAGTCIWWMKQSDYARNKISALPFYSLKDSLNDFKNWLAIYDKKDLFIWGNSASFDCGILKAAYKAVGMEVPWDFYNERCYRTITKHFNNVKLTKDASKAHDPIYDCEYQIKVLVQTLKNLES